MVNSLPTYAIVTKKYLKGSWDLVDADIIPKSFEKGLNYVVTEKVQPAKRVGYILQKKPDGKYYILATRDGWVEGSVTPYSTEEKTQAALDKTLSKGEAIFSTLQGAQSPRHKANLAKS